MFMGGEVFGRVLCELKREKSADHINEKNAFAVWNFRAPENSTGRLRKKRKISRRQTDFRTVWSESLVCRLRGMPAGITLVLFQNCTVIALKIEKGREG